MVTSTVFTLGDLLKADHLGLELIVGDESCLSRSISGAHTIEIEHPARWLDRGWVMLTTGVKLPRNSADQGGLVAELDDADITALGFGIDVIHKSIPSGIVAEAKRRNFPIFTIPLRTAFRDVVGDVYRSVLSQELRMFNRLTAMQRFLIDAIGGEAPRSTIVYRLSYLIGARVGLVRPDGQVELASETLPGSEIATAIRARPSSAVAFETTNLHGLAFPLPVQDCGENQWLVVAVPQGQRLHPLTRPAAHTAIPLLAATARLDRIQKSQDRAVRRATFETLLEVDDWQEARVAAARALACGLDIARGVTVFAATDPTGRANPAELLDAADRTFTQAQIPVLSTVWNGKLSGMLAAPVTDELLTEHILSLGPGLSVGLGRTTTDPLGVRQALSDAALAIRDSVHRRHTAIVRYDDLDLGTVLVNEVSFDRLAPKIERWLQPLRENPLVYQTVVSYLHHHLDVAATARELRLHPNSVRYRLSRAEELIAAPLRSPSTIAALHVALLADGNGYFSAHKHTGTHPQRAPAARMATSRPPASG
jgi:purine catabolism regulator